jgi:hypothetical protein
MEEEEITTVSEVDVPEQLSTIVNLINENKIDDVKSKFNNREDIVTKSLLEWEIAGHQVMNRKDLVSDTGDIIKQWKLPIAYQKKIVQSSVAFLFGKAIKLKQESTGTDDVFNDLLNLRKKMRMQSKDQLNAEKMLSETECAKLFVPYKNGNLSADELAKPGIVSVKCILLAKSLGDTLYTLFDEFGILRAFARGYKTKDESRDVEHLDIYTADFIYYCTNKSAWVVDKQTNLLGKIPVVYYMQDRSEWSDVQPIIERREYLTSRRADNNDLSGDAILVLEGEVQSLPQKEKVGKVVQMGVGGKASYLYPQMAIDLVKDEKEDLKELIHYLTDTPDLSMQNMATMGQDSGKALEMRFFGALLKAMGKHEYFAEMIDRENSILKAFIGKIIDTGKAALADKLEVSIEFGNPLPDNFADTITMLTSATAGKAILSQKTAVSLNPLVSDPIAESELLGEEEISLKAEDI